MKNLFVNKSIDFDVATEIIGYCVDVDNGSLFVIDENFQVSKMDTKCPQASMEVIQTNLELQDVHRGQITRDQIRLVDYIVESGSILVAMKDGHVIRIAVAPYSPPSGYIYQHKCAISSIRISPDQDLIALADENNEIIMMSTSEMSIFSQQNALTQDHSAHKPVGVGWGSKETQFFGLDGRPSKEKQAAQQVQLTDDEMKVIGQIETSDIFNKLKTEKELQTLVDWRGDGQLLATLTFIPDAQKHYLKVWNRNLELQYMSEQLVTIERGLLSWVPDGKYVCCAQRRDNVLNEIAMFEKNGMVHERLTLPTMIRNAYIDQMSWSNDSKVLAIIVNQFYISADQQVGHRPILLLYTTQNFHHYLKFSCYLSKDCSHDLRWDPICSNRLRIITSDGHYSEYDCNFEVSNFKSWCYVIDANKLLITPMNLCTPPPPMCTLLMELDSLIYKLAVDPNDPTNISILTFDGFLICKNLDASESDADSPVKLSTQIKSCENLLTGLRGFKSYNIEVAALDVLQDFVCLGPQKYVGTKLTGGDCDIFKFVFEGPNVRLETILTLKGKRVSSVAIPQDSSAMRLPVILNDCSCLDICLQPTQEMAKMICKFEPNAAQNRLSFISSQCVPNSNKLLLVSLSNDLTLRVNETTLASNICTSFRLIDDYLVYTTTDNQMHFILLTTLQNEKDRAKMKSWSQQIEYGGTLVAIIDNVSKVVLQMPRGNLEILRPRILLIAALTALLDSKKYAEAAGLARNHRVDMNFICDYLMRDLISGTELRYQSLTEFASNIALHDPNLLNNFIYDLANEDTIKSRYNLIIDHLPPRARRFELERKIELDKINMVLLHIKLPEDSKYTHQRIMCFLKKEPRDIQGALRLIHDSDKKTKELALKFILYFVSVDELFNQAIKSYNTDIALMVASGSNKDPKEYLVLLDNFNEIKDTHRRHLAMDLYAKDYEAAIRNLLSIILTSPDDCEALQSQFLDLTISKRLFAYALETLYVCESPSMLMSKVWLSYGSYLLEKRYFKEAGLAYSKSLDLQPSKETLKSSLTCFSLSGAYDMSIATLASAKIEDEVKQQHKAAILKELIDKKKIVLYLAYLGGTIIPDDDFNKLMDGGNFFIMEAFSSNKKMIQTRIDIKRKLNDLYHETVRQFTWDLKKAQKHFDRLKDLLVAYQDKKYNQARVENYCADTLSSVADSELSSQGSSGSGSQNQGSGQARSGAPSLKTRASNKSNKQAFKKKRITLKPGSRHEDLALIMDLKKFISKLESNQTESSELLAISFKYEDLISARSKSTTLKKILEDMFEFSKTVNELLWPINSMVEQKYSLYRRFSDTIAVQEETYEDLDFLTLIRPEMPSELQLFSM